MVLESIASSLLTKYLGDYVEGLGENLKLTVTSGNIVLKDLKLKTDALRDLELPVQIKQGILGKLVLKIPWSNLGNEAAIVRLSDVFLLVSPKDKTAGTAREREDRALAQKMSRLQLAEMLGLDKPAAEDEPKDSKDEKEEEKGWIGSLIMKVVDNVQIFVDRVHIRYEDSLSVAGQTFAAGVTLDHVHVQSTDENWQPSFLKVAQSILHKHLDLLNLGVYFNTSGKGAQPLDYVSDSHFRELMGNMIQSESGSSYPHHYILQPISGSLKAQIDSEKKKFIRPRMHFEFDFDRIAFAFDRPQYLSILSIAENFSLTDTGSQYAKFLPPPDHTPTTHPREWWNFAINSIKSDVEKENSQWQWSYIKKRKEDRNHYIRLYKLHKKKKKMTPNEVEILDTFHRLLSYEDILIYRKLANASIQRELAKEAEVKAQKGWFSNLWSSSEQTEVLDDADTVAWNELYTAIGYHEDDKEKKAAAASVSLFPKEFVKMQFVVMVRAGSLELDELQDGNRVSFMYMGFKGLTTNVALRDTSTSVALSITKFDAKDYHTRPDVELPFIDMPLDRPGSAEALKNILDIAVDLNPIDTDKEIDLRVKLTARPLQITFSRLLIDHVVAMFKPPESSAAVAEIAGVAAKSLDELRKQTSDRLTYMLEKQSKLLLHLDLRAPTIVVPQDFSNKNCPTIIADLGHIVINHDSTAREAHVERSDVEETKVALASVNNDYFYDVFNLKMDRLNVFMAAHSSPDHWGNYSHNELKHRALVRPFDIKFSLSLLTVKTPSLPNIKLEGQLPSLTVVVTPHHLRDLLKVIDVVVNPHGADAVAADAPVPALMPADVEIESLAAKRKANRSSRASSSFTPSASTSLSLGGSLSVPGKKEGESVKEVVKDPAIDISFTVGTLKVKLNESLTQTFNTLSTQQSESYVIVPGRKILTVSLRALQMHMEQSNHSLELELKLKALHVYDKVSSSSSSTSKKKKSSLGKKKKTSSSSFSSSSSSTPMIQTIEKVKGEQLITLNFLMIPSSSSVYKNVDNEMAAAFGSLELNVNRPTIASLLQWLNSLASSVSSTSDASSPAAAAPPSGAPAPTAMAVEKPSTAKFARIETLFKLALSMQEIRVNLLKESQPLLTASLTNMTLNLLQEHNGNLVLSSSLSEMEVVSHVESLAQKHIAQGRSSSSSSSNANKKSPSRLLSLHFNTFNAAAPSYPGYDLSVALRLEPLEISITHLFLAELLEYFSAFSKMQQIVSRASSKVLDKTKEAAKAVGSTAAKMKLAIEIASPIILIPRSAYKLYPLMDVRLGRIKIANSFEMEKGEVLDHMNISITDMGLTLAQSAKQTQSIIEHGDISVSLSRPLSANAQHVVPGLKVSVQIGKQVVYVRQSEVMLLLSFLSHNLSEKPMKDIKEVQIVSEALNFDMTKYELEATAASSTTSSSSSSLAAKEDFISLYLDVALPDFGVYLAAGNGKDDAGKSTSIMSYHLTSLFASVIMQDSGSMKVKASLGDMILTDERISTDIFKQILGRKKLQEANTLSPPSSPSPSPSLSASSSEDSLIVVSFVKDSTKNTQEIDFNLHSPQIYLQPSFLTALTAFTLPFLEDVTTTLSTVSFGEEEEKQEEVDVSKLPPGITSVPTRPPKKDEEGPTASLVVKASLHAPRIVLLADSKSSSSASLFINFGIIDVMFSQSDGVMQVQSTLKDLHVSRATFVGISANSPGVVKNKIDLLEPWGLSLTFKNSASGDGDASLAKTTVAIVADETLKTIVSYRDLVSFMDYYGSFLPLLALLSKPTDEDDSALPYNARKKTTKKLSKLIRGTSKGRKAGEGEGEGEGDEDDEEEDEEEEDHSVPEIDVSAAIDGLSLSTSSNQLVTDAATAAEEEAGVDDPLTMNVALQLGGVIFSLLDDSLSVDYALPILKFVASPIQVALGRGANSMEVYTMVETFMLDSYSVALSGFEPIMEPWSLEFTLSQKNGVNDLHLVANEMINLNVTHPLLDTVTAAGKLAKELGSKWASINDAAATTAASSSSSSVASFSTQTGMERSSLGFASYTLVNSTNIDVFYWQSKGAKKTKVKAGQSLTLPLAVERGKKLKKQIASFSFSSTVMDTPIHNARIDRVGKQSFNLSTVIASLRCVIDVGMNGSTKVVTLRSNSLIQNSTSYPLSVRIPVPPSAGGSGGGDTILVLPSHDSISLPLTTPTNSLIEIRPINTSSFSSTTSRSNSISGESAKERANEKASKRGSTHQMEMVMDMSDGSMSGGVGLGSRYEWSRVSSKALSGLFDIYACLPKSSSSSTSSSSAALVPCWTAIATDEVTPIENGGSDRLIEISPPYQVENLLPYPVTLQFSESDSELMREVVKTGSVKDYHFTYLSRPSLSSQGAGKGEKKVTEEELKDLLREGVKAMEFGLSLDSLSLSSSLVRLRGSEGKQQKAFTLSDSDSNTLTVKVEMFTDGLVGVRRAIVFCSHWISNCTGIPLNFAKASSSSPKLLASQPLFVESKAPLSQRDWYSYIKNNELSQTETLSSPSPSSSSSPTPSPSPSPSPSTPAPVTSSTSSYKFASPTETSESLPVVKEDGSDSIYAGPRWPRVLYGDDEKVRVRMFDSQWSEPFPLGGKNEGQIELSDPSSGRNYPLSVVVEPGPGKYWRTSLAKISPAIVIVNLSGNVLEFMQEGVEESESYLKENEQLPFYWESATAKSRLSVRLSGSTSSQSTYTSWSTPLHLHDVTNTQLKLKTIAPPNDDGDDGSDGDDGEGVTPAGSTVGLHVDMRMIRGTMYVIFGGAELPFYRIDNLSSEDVVVVQKGFKDSQVVAAGQSVSYFWDDPQVEERLLLLSIAQAEDPSLRTISLDTLKKYKSIKGKAERVTLEVIADGPTRTLVVADRTGGFEESTESETEVQDLLRKPTLTLTLAVKGIALCVMTKIRERQRALLYLTLQTLSVKFELSNVDQRLSFSVGTMQIDNQLYRTPFPIILADKSPSSTHFLELTYVRDTHYPTIHYVKYFGVLVQEMDIEIDQSFLVETLCYVETLTKFMNELRGVEKEPLFVKGEEERLTLLSASTLHASTMFYFEMLHLNPVKANLSFLTYQGDDDERESSTMQNILSYIGPIADMQGAPLKLNCLLLENPFASQSELTNLIVAHYTASVLRQTYLLLGSSDFLGNPVSLISNLGTGVHDFFHEPAAGIVTSPAEFGKGVLRGTSSLVKKSVFALFGTASKLTGTLGKLGAIATFDEDYQRARARMKTQRARHVGEGVVMGVRDLGVGLFKGITGIVTEPIKGAQKDGAVGLLKGVGKGLVGVVLKPVVGVTDLVSRTAEGISNTTTLGDAVKARIRPPRVVGEDNLLRIYSFQKSFGALLLYSSDDGYYKNHVFVAHSELPEQKHLILTTTHLLLFRPAKFEFGDVYTTSWRFHLGVIATAAANKDYTFTIKTIPERTRGEKIVRSAVVGKDNETFPRFYSKLQDSLDNLHHHQRFRHTLPHGENAFSDKGKERDGGVGEGSGGSGDVSVDVGRDDPSWLRGGGMLDESSSEDAERIVERRKKTKSKKKASKGSEKTPLLGGEEGGDFDGEGKSSCCSCCTIL